MYANYTCFNPELGLVFLSYSIRKWSFLVSSKNIMQAKG